MTIEQVSETVHPAGERKPRRRVVFVMSCNYSGSTVLGLVLSSHSRASALGEPALILRRDRQGEFKHQRFCAVCADDDGSSCPVWNRELIDEVRKSPDDLWRLATERLGSRDFYVDMSKEVSWVERAAANPDVDPWIVHISKPVESFVGSILNRHPSQRVGFVAADWVAANEQIRDQAVRLSLPYLHIRYEDFALRFDEILGLLGRFIGFAPEPGQANFWEISHHYVKGNPGVASNFDSSRIDKQTGANRELYRENHRRIFLDEKWKKIVPPAAVDLIYSQPAVEQLSQSLGYRHPARTNGLPFSARLRGRVLEPMLGMARSTYHSLRGRS
jgi:hypothetical protein